MLFAGLGSVRMVKNCDRGRIFWNTLSGHRHMVITLERGEGSKWKYWRLKNSLVQRNRYFSESVSTAFVPDCRDLFPPFLDGMQVHCRAPPSIKIVGTHLYTWVERGTVTEQSVLPKQLMMWCPWPGLKHGMLDPELSTVTMRPPRLFVN